MVLIEIFLLALIAILMLKGNRSNMLTALLIGVMNMLLLGFFDVHPLIQIGDGILVAVISLIMGTIPYQDDIYRLVGKKGVVVDEIFVTKAGKVRIHGELRDAMDSDGVGIQLDSKVKVTAVRDNVLMVRNLSKGG